MRARHNRRWRREQHRARTLCLALDATYREIFRLSRAEYHARVARQGGISDPPAPAPMSDRLVRLNLRWDRLAEEIARRYPVANQRYVFKAPGGGELYRGRCHMPTPDWPWDLARHPWYGEKRPPPPAGHFRWRVVSLQRYRALDSSALVSYPEGLDYMGLTPEDRGFRLRFPTKRHRLLNAWRVRNGYRPVRPRNVPREGLDAKQGPGLARP
jgi:hypothetical protein